MSLFAIVIMIFVSTASYGFAEEKGKVIFIDMNRTNLGSMMNIPILKNEIEKRGYVALMNIRGIKVLMIEGLMQVWVQEQELV